MENRCYCCILFDFAKLLFECMCSAGCKSFLIELHSRLHKSQYILHNKNSAFHSISSFLWGTFFQYTYIHFFFISQPLVDVSSRTSAVQNKSFSCAHTVSPFHRVLLRYVLSSGRAYMLKHTFNLNIYSLYVFIASKLFLFHFSSCFDDYTCNKENFYAYNSATVLATRLCHSVPIISLSTKPERKKAHTAEILFFFIVNDGIKIILYKINHKKMFV